MIKNTLLFLLLTTVVSLYSQEWNQANASKVTFKIKNFGVNVDGDFNDIKIETNFNSNTLSKSYINAIIKVKSISTGIESRDEHILEEDYFDERTHKTITLKSKKILKSKNEDFVLFADLTIKGKTKRIEVPLEVLETESTIKIKSNFTINRKDFNVGGGSFILSKTVKVQVEYSGNKQIE